MIIKLSYTIAYPGASGLCIYSKYKTKYPYTTLLYPDQFGSFRNKPLLYTK